jgi:hypothetical protein
MSFSDRAPNQFLQLTVGIQPVKLGYQHPEGGSDPKSDPSPPTATEKWRWAAGEMDDDMCFAKVKN